MEQGSMEVQEQFIYAQHLLFRLQMGRFHQFGPHGNPQRGQGRVLAILQKQPEMTQKELGYLLDMRNQSLGELLNKLEKSGYITRTPSKEDRRTTLIRLTAAGANAAEEAKAKREKLPNIFDQFTEEERQTLLVLLKKLIGALQHQLAEQGEEDPHGRAALAEKMRYRAAFFKEGMMPPEAFHGGRGRGMRGPRPGAAFFEREPFFEDPEEERE